MPDTTRGLQGLDPWTNGSGAWGLRLSWPGQPQLEGLLVNAVVEQSRGVAEHECGLAMDLEGDESVQLSPRREP